jgi:hypothetical protein
MREPRGEMLDTDAWIKRADEVVASISNSNYSEGMQFATSMIAAFYGADSPQMKTFRETAQSFQKAQPHILPFALADHAKGTIQNIKVEIQAGLIKSVRALLTGEIVAELVGLAKEISADQSDAAKNVSAVLVAAAFEDVIRRMGTEFGGVIGRPNLEQVINTLKQRSVLKGGEVTTALGYLKFRNDSLHADWPNVQQSQIASCLAFVEALLVKHFS